MEIALIDGWVHCEVEKLPGRENSNASTPEESIDVCCVLLEKVQCAWMIQIYSLTNINDPQLILQARSRIAVCICNWALCAAQCLRVPADALVIPCSCTNSALNIAQMQQYRHSKMLLK